jgi:hypothetical protein
MKTIFPIALGFIRAACGSPGDQSYVTVRDSAGIGIVESQRPQWQEGEGWTLSPEPILEIGVSDGEEPYMLDQVRAVARFDDGGIVVGNSGDNTLRFYDASGVFLHSAGGSGGGPEEFADIMGFRRLGDSVLVWQFTLNPSKVFDRQGNHIHTLQTPKQMVSIQGVFADGAHLFSLFASSPPPSEDFFVHESPLYISTPDFAATDSLGTFPWWNIVTMPQEYGARRGLAVGDDEWYYGWPETYEFRVLDKEGSVRRIVRRAWEPVPVTDADRQRYRESMLGLGTEDGGPVPPRVAQQRRDMANGMVFPDHHPAYLSIHPGASGHVWVMAGPPGYPTTVDAPTTWDVFGPSGAWLGSMTFPARFVVHEIGESHVAGVWRDEMDVQRVRVYELVKRAGRPGAHRFR